jgi:hypothetical protein
MLWVVIVAIVAFLVVTGKSVSLDLPWQIRPSPPVVQYSSDRASTGADFGDLFGGGASPHYIPDLSDAPHMPEPANVPVRHAPRDDTPIFPASGS